MVISLQDTRLFRTVVCQLRVTVLVSRSTPRHPIAFYLTLPLLLSSTARLPHYIHLALAP